MIGTIPSAILGVLAEKLIQDSLGAPWLIGVMLVVFGLVLYIVDRRAPASRCVDEVRLADGLRLGIAQAMALRPGVSRSGVTITAARATNFDRESAAHVSFLLSVPVIAGAALFEGLEIAQTGLGQNSASFVWGVLSSAGSSFVFIWIILAYVRRRNLGVFVWYRVAVAAVVLTLIATGARPATA